MTGQKVVHINYIVSNSFQTLKVTIKDELLRNNKCCATFDLSNTAVRQRAMKITRADCVVGKTIACFVDLLMCFSKRTEPI